MKLALYGYWRSSSTWRVRIALAWKGLAYEHRAVHLLRDGGEQHTADHVARNPMHQIPVLEVDGVAIGQSVAIIELLEELRPSPSLFPTDPIDRARARQIVEGINSGIQPLQNLAVMKELTHTWGHAPEQARSWSAAWIARGFDALERLAERSAGRYLVGDAVCVADVFLVPQMYNARRFGLDPSSWPVLARVEAAAIELDAFRSTRPETQPDAEP
jgi:maleylacetoacetate isomerase